MEAPHQINRRLGRDEFLLGRMRLQSRPRTLGIVLANACNLRCVHCYQPKNSDSLLAPAAAGRKLRRQLASFYPYLSSLRLLGGEVFALPGFAEILADVAAAGARPLVSVSTNGTLIDEAWARRIVAMPFAGLTVSIDGATPATYARLRGGADLEHVLANVRRIQAFKTQRGSRFPHLDSFFVVMRSNFREIPLYLERMHALSIADVALQIVELGGPNAALAATESLRGEDSAELHALLVRVLPRERRRFRMIRVSGARSLFEAHGLDASFLMEEAQGLYPESDGLDTAGLCPNPWTTLFITENGNAHLCFLSQPIGNLHAMSLERLWNCEAAQSKRAAMAAGRYLASGCARAYCSWREGAVYPRPPLACRIALESRCSLTATLARLRCSHS